MMNMSVYNCTGNDVTIEIKSLRFQRIRGASVFSPYKKFLARFSLLTQEDAKFVALTRKSRDADKRKRAKYKEHRDFVFLASLVDSRQNVSKCKSFPNESGFLQMVC